MNAFFEVNEARVGHGRHALKSGVVSIAARLVNAFIQIGAVLFLARLLSPEDYGLVSMVMSIVGFAPLVTDLGTRDAVVQRQTITEREVSALLFITTGAAAVMTLAVAASGPWIARFYGEPRLTMIALVSSLTFITTALSCQHYALLRRAMMFDRIGPLEVLSNLVAAATAVSMAWAGLHFWALVTRPIVAAVMLAIGVWWQCRWLPPAPAFTKNVREMLRFGLNVTGFTLTDFASRSVDRIAIGYRFGAIGLGFYQNALFVYENLSDILVGPLHGVAVASLSKVRHDPKEVWRYLSKALSVVTFFAMPSFGGLAVVSQDLIVIVLGQKWASAGVLLGIIALRGIPQSVERTLGWLHVTAGRSDRWARWGFVAAVAQILALLAGLPFGPSGVAWAYVIANTLMVLPAVAYAGQPMGIRVGSVLKTVWPAAVGSVVAVVVGFALRDTVLAGLDHVSRVIALGLAYTATYLILTVLVFRETLPLMIAARLCRDFLPNRIAALMPGAADEPQS